MQLLLLIFLSLSAYTKQLEVKNEVGFMYDFYIENKIFVPKTSEKTNIIFKGTVSIQDSGNQTKLGQVSEVVSYQRLGLSRVDNQSSHENILFKLITNNQIIFQHGTSSTNKNLVKVIVGQLTNTKFNYTITRNIFDYEVKEYSHKTKSNGVNNLLRTRTVYDKDNVLISSNTLQSIILDSFKYAQFSSEIKLNFKNKINTAWKIENFVESSIESSNIDFGMGNDFLSFKYEEMDVLQKIVNLSASIGRSLNDSRISFHTISLTMKNYVNLIHLVRLRPKEDLDNIANMLMDGEKPESPYLSLCSTEPFEGFYVFKRALAQAYTTESINMIEKCMIKGKISRGEASDLIKLTLQTLPNSITEEYANALYSLIRNELHYTPENDISIAFAKVLHKFEEKSIKFVCRTKYCDFSDISTDYIGFLATKLEDSIRIGTNNKKIMLYIEAISSMKTMKVFHIFKPYIARKKQVSKFQRLRMLSKLENLIKYNNTDLFEFLYESFENSEEETDVRILAVYLVLLTNPPLEIWFKIAKIANDKTHPTNLRSSITSALISASRLSGEMGSNANSTLQLLQEKYYREENSKIYIGSSSYLGNEYSWKGYALASGDSSIPKAIKLSIYKNNQEAEEVGIDYGISSFKNLKEVYNRLFLSFQSQVQKQKDNYKISNKGLYSEDITKLLNINQPEDEQLEAILSYNFEGLGNLISLNNKTIESLPKQISSTIDYFPNGISCLKTNLGNNYEKTIKIPTITGILLTYSENQPVFLNMAHHIKINSTTPLSYGETFMSPNATQVNMDINASYTKTIIRELAMQTLYNHKLGIEHNTDTQIFLQGSLNVVFAQRTSKISAKVIIKRPKGNVPLVRFRNNHYLKNYTSQITSVCKAIRLPSKTEVCNVFNKSTDSGFLVKYSGDCYDGNVSRIVEIIRKKDYGAIPILNDSFYIQEFSVMLPPTISKKEIIFLYQSIRKFRDLCTLHNLPQVNVVDCEFTQHRGSIQLDKTDFSIMTSQYRSNIDESGFFRFSSSTTNKITNTTSMAIEMNILSETPNYVELDLNHTLSSIPQTNHSAQLKLSFEKETYDLYSTIYLRRTIENSEFIKNHPAVINCYLNTNHQTESCAKLNNIANISNEIEFNLILDPKQIQTPEQYEPIKNNIWIGSLNSTNFKHLQILLAFKPDLVGLNLTLSSKRKIIKHFNDIYVPSTLLELILMNPRIKASINGYKPYETQCIIEPKVITTFDGKMYYSSFGPKWHILMHYLPITSRISQVFLDTYQRQEEQTMQMTILAKQHIEDPNKIDVLLSIRSKETQHKLLNLKVITDGVNSTYLVAMNGKIISDKLSERKSVHFKHFVQIFLIPNNELKIVVKDLLYLVYDGYKVKLVALSDDFRGTVWGLCGNMDDDPSNDFRLPNGSIIKEEQQFISNYTLANQ